MIKSRNRSYILTELQPIYIQSRQRSFIFRHSALAAATAGGIFLLICFSCLSGPRTTSIDAATEVPLSWLGRKRTHTDRGIVVVVPPPSSASASSSQLFTSSSSSAASSLESTRTSQNMSILMDDNNDKHNDGKQQSSSSFSTATNARLSTTPYIRGSVGAVGSSRDNINDAATATATATSTGGSTPHTKRRVKVVKVSFAMDDDDISPPPPAQQQHQSQSSLDYYKYEEETSTHRAFKEHEIRQPPNIMLLASIRKLRLESKSKR